MPQRNNMEGYTMIEIDTWVAGGYKVRAFDWIDGESIYLNIAYYRPGAAFSKPPTQERSFLLPMSEGPKIKNFLHSIVTGLMAICEEGVCYDARQIEHAL